ncbi:MAG: tRNA (adenosine(37)-N6)-threonylcarbamoyltransferase complex dimerization subunit type 1 TsaB [Solirubrobacterales bacterium]
MGFDTATQDTAVCAQRDGGVLYEALLGLSEDGSPGHTTRLLGEIEAAAAAAGGWSEVEAIAVGLGPGSFTGLRVGIATARALAASLCLPVRGACTLDALAHGLGATLAAACRPRLAIIDARRGEVFVALHASSGERLWEPWVGTPAELSERAQALPEPPLAAGSGALRFRDELASCGVEVAAGGDVHRVAARDVCALAVEGGAKQLSPIYLRPPDAERWHERDTSQRTE